MATLDTLASLPKEFYYWRTRSPAPLLLVIDFEARYRERGYGNRRIVAWCFGSLAILSDRTLWRLSPQREAAARAVRGVPPPAEP